MLTLPRHFQKIKVKKNILILTSFLLLIGCAGNKTDERDVQEDRDSSATACGDSLAMKAEARPSAADGLFDDFIYTFMRDRAFQNGRIRFPLPCKTDGKQKMVGKDEWSFDCLYSREDVYTMLFDDEASVGSEKDSSVTHVIVEWVYLDQRRVKQYLFDKASGLWMLTGIDSHSLSESVNEDFYDFYRRFAVDEKFQRRHIENPFAFKTYDPDSYQELEGLLDVAQWPDYRPELPRKAITNINYEQDYADDGNRVFVITSPSAGMSCTLHFRKRQSQWMLVGLENI